MDDIEYWQTVAQWEEYADLIQRASQSRSDAIQLQKAVSLALKQGENREKTRDFS